MALISRQQEVHYCRKPRGGQVSLFGDSRLAKPLLLYLFDDPALDFRPLGRLQNTLIDQAVTVGGSGAFDPREGRYAVSSSSAADFFVWKTAAAVAHNIGTGDFTFACRVRKPTTIGGNYSAIAANGTFSPGIYWNVTGQWGAYWSADREAGSALSADTWYTLAFCRKGGTLYFFKDGRREPNTHAVSTSMSNAVLTVGGNGNATNDVDGHHAWFGMWPFGIEDGEAMRLHRDFRSLFQPQRRLFVAAGGGTTVNLSGASSTGAAGLPSVTGAASITVTGASSTGSVGTMTATGAAVAAIVGSSATGSAGALTATGAANITITGVSSTGQVGTLTVTVGGAVTVGLTGVSATGRVGLPTVTGAASVNVTGASSTGSPGTITATVGGTTVILTGAGANGQVGTLSITGAANIAMSGASATGAAGSLSVTIPGSESHIVATITITPAIGGTLELQPAINGEITIN